ncbi:MAG: class I SAM-dependent methyltransferase [Bacteroidota bacterium]
MEKYDRIGKTYNDTRKADPYLLGRMQALLQCKAGQRVLDIGCGTGNYTIALAAAGLEMLGVEPSMQMLETARSRNASLSWHLGKAENIPLADSSVDAALASLTLHHWANLGAGFKEVARVLRSGGSFVIFTATPQQMQGYWLNHYFPQMLADSMAQMPNWDAITTAAKETGLVLLKTEAYEIHNQLVDHFLYVGKSRPQLYLSPEVRQGISSFADLSRKEEVEQGLKKLAHDIHSGAIQAVRQSYQHSNGDYLFVVWQKA